MLQHRRLTATLASRTARGRSNAADRLQSLLKLRIMRAMRKAIHQLKQNGITKVAMPRIGDPEVLALWFGEGDEPTAEFIRQAAKQALDDGVTFYGHTRGIAPLRRAIKTYLDDLYEIDVEFDRITVPGSSMLAVTIAAHMTLSRGDHAVIVSPHWPNIDRNFSAIGARIDYVRQQLTDTGWQLSLDDLKAACSSDTRTIYLNSPSNPTGWVMSLEEQRALLDFCRERDIVIIADEVYHRTVYDNDVAPSFLQIAKADDPVIVINGFSKAFAMTGWRLGWMVVPQGLEEAMAVLSECYNTSAPTFIQQAGIVALEQGESVIRALRKQYAEGRQIVIDELADHPRITLSKPEGAFYAFPHIDGMNNSLEFVQQLLSECNVGLAPGYTFGPGNESHVRLCFAQSHQRLREALRRLCAFLD